MYRPRYFSSTFFNSAAVSGDDAARWSLADDVAKRRPAGLELIDQRAIKGRKAGAYIVPGNHVSIDTEWDIELVEFILSRRTSQSGKNGTA